MKYGWEDVWAGKPIGATRLVKNTTRCTFLGLSLFIGQATSMPSYFFTKSKQPASNLYTHHHNFPAQASNPPEHASPLHDLRPAHWVELSKNGDAYVLSKEGLSVGLVRLYVVVFFFWFKPTFLPPGNYYPIVFLGGS